MTLAVQAGRAPVRSHARLLTERRLFVATILVAAGLVWLAPRLPMVDLPQHAAQVAIWHDLLLGTSPWGDVVRINLLTPYLIGYGLLLPLSFVMPLATATRVLLTLDVLAFVAGCVALRRALGGDRRLDWLFPFGFYGFAWKWGFLTFLTAAPLGLVFLLVAVRHVARPSFRCGLLLGGVGLLLLFSHALIFLMAGGLGGLLALRRLRHAGLRSTLPILAPFLALGVALLAFRLLTRSDADGFQFDTIVYGVPLWLRPAASLAYVTDLDWGTPLSFATVLAALAVPIVLRCRANQQGGALVFAALCAVLLAVPAYAVQTAYVFERFALFLVPFAALACRLPAVEDATRSKLGLIIAALACWTMLATTGWQVLAFGSESRSFETVLAAAEPGQRALALIYDRDSAAAGNAQAYMHFAAWYQADKHGFVDFNFAAFPPQVVRFRVGHRPPVTERLGWKPETYDWTSATQPYALIFFRGSVEDLAALRRASPCPLPILAEDGLWRLLRPGACGAAPASPPPS